MMNSIQVLMDRFWIRKDEDKDLYYQARREIRDIDKFAGEYPGWRLLSNERVIKLEKTPVCARPYMGITEFKDSLDYAILCGLLIYLEDREDTECFLLSEFIDRLEIEMKSYHTLDWTMYGQRKSLIRAMQFAEKIGLLTAHEGDVDLVSGDINNEVLYENTGLSRYFCVNYSYDVSGMESYADFEKEDESADTDRGHFRINRVYRRLLSEPAMYWGDAFAEMDNNADPNDNNISDRTAVSPVMNQAGSDSYYLKNQRGSIAARLHETLGGRLDVHKNAAFYIQEDEDERVGESFSGGATINDVILLVCGALRQRKYVHRADDTVVISREEFISILNGVRNEYLPAWSKEFREMDPERYITLVCRTMQEWMLIGDEGSDVRLYPGAFKLSGHYPKDFDPVKYREDVESDNKGAHSDNESVSDNKTDRDNGQIKLKL